MRALEQSSEHLRTSVPAGLGGRLVLVAASPREVPYGSTRNLLKNGGGSLFT
jgi:hypothetical protein